jgi:hypothetical protein
MTFVLYVIEEFYGRKVRVPTSKIVEGRISHEPWTSMAEAHPGAY